MDFRIKAIIFVCVCFQFLHLLSGDNSQKDETYSSTGGGNEFHVTAILLEGDIATDSEDGKIRKPVYVKEEEIVSKVAVALEQSPYQPYRRRPFIRERPILLLDGDGEVVAGYKYSRVKHLFLPCEAKRVGDTYHLGSPILEAIEIGPEGLVTGLNAKQFLVFSELLQPYIDLDSVDVK